MSKIARLMTSLGPEEYFARLARLLDMEGRAAAQQAAERSRRLAPAEAERSGTCLVDLVVRDEEPGLGGRHLLRLGRRKRSPLPWTRLGVGSPVLLTPLQQRGDVEYRGVICEHAADSVQVALSHIPDDLDEHESWRIDLSSDDVATERSRRAIREAAQAKHGRLAELRDVLLARRPCAYEPAPKEPALDTGLNESQEAAVQFALSASDVALIHGPPGPARPRPWWS